MKQLEIPLSKIEQKTNSRFIYKEEDLAELMVSMKQSGLLQPVGVRLNGLKYELVFGHRRFTAAKKLGWKSIPAREINVEKGNGAILANLTENIIRKDPSMLEQSQTFHALIKVGLTPSEIAARLGISVGRIERYLDASRAVPKRFQEKIVHMPHGSASKKGKIPGSVMILLENAKKTSQMSGRQANQIYELAKTDNVSVRKIQGIIADVKAGKSVSSA